ncbi:MAG: esterase [Bacilli bacterium]|nr:esterase [Bacilli bacterium]
MKYEEASWYSERLERWMHIKVYGHYGPAFIAFPCQNKQSDDFYNNGMIDALSWYLENGKMKLFCLDSNDDETVSSLDWNKMHAAYKFEMYHQYIVNEVLPFVYNAQGGYNEPYLIGASMGGSQAANHFFRRPELFSGFISLSGKFDMEYFFDDYVDENVYNNSPAMYLNNMPTDHPYINIYNSKKMIVVVGRGSFEYLALDSNYQLADIAYRKGIHIDFNFWDEYSVHDRKSWNYQMPYFISKLL